MDESDDVGMFEGEIPQSLRQLGRARFCAYEQSKGVNTQPSHVDEIHSSKKNSAGL